MNTGPDYEKLEKQIQKFLVIYKILVPEAKAQFEAQMNANLKNVDEKTKKLYAALLNAAKQGDNMDEAISAMHKANEEGREQ